MTNTENDNPEENDTEHDMIMEQFAMENSFFHPVIINK